MLEKGFINFSNFVKVLEVLTSLVFFIIFDIQSFHFFSVFTFFFFPWSSSSLYQVTFGILNFSFLPIFSLLLVAVASLTTLTSSSSSSMPSSYLVVSPFSAKITACQILHCSYWSRSRNRMNSYPHS